MMQQSNSVAIGVDDTHDNGQSDDPFPMVQRDVQAAWQSLQTGLLPPRECQAHLESLEADVHDLQTAVDIARAEPERFSITERQLADRATFTDAMRRNLAAYRRDLLTGGANKVGVGGNGHEEEVRANEAFVDDQMRVQADIIRGQDDDLDHLSNAVQRIGNLGRDMHVELEEQGQLLDDLGGRFDTTLSRMKAVRQRVEVVMEQTGRRQFCTIVWLSLTFLVLTALVVLT